MKLKLLNKNILVQSTSIKKETIIESLNPNPNKEQWETSFEVLEIGENCPTIQIGDKLILKENTFFLTVKVVERNKNKVISNDIVEIDDVAAIIIEE